MGWFAKFFGSKENEEEDPILSRCKLVIGSLGIELDEDEWSSIIRNRDILASSALGVAYVQKNVFHVLCYLCVFDGIFERGVELMQKGNYQAALSSLGKAIKVLPWPSALYASGVSWEMLGNKDKAKHSYRTTVDNYEKGSALILEIIPDSIPSRSDFATNTKNRLDKSSALLLGHIDMADVISIARDKTVWSA